MGISIGILRDSLQKQGINIQTNGDTTYCVEGFLFWSGVEPEGVDAESIAVGVGSIADERLMYVCDARIVREASVALPSHLTVIVDNASVEGGRFPEADFVVSDCAISRFMRAATDILVNHEEWCRRLLLAAADRVSIGRFLEIAVAPLDNPLALFDNSMIELASAGTFSKSIAGTIWDCIVDGISPIGEFYSVEEQRTVSRLAQASGDAPYFYHLSADPSHEYTSFQVHVEGKVVASVGGVDVNVPFTDGQRQLLVIVSEMLHRYFAWNDALTSLVGSEHGGVDQLLEGNPVAQRLVAQYLANRGWRSADTYLVLCFLCPIALVGPAEESTYLRMVGALFGGAIVTVHDGLLVVVIHRADYRDHAWGAALDQLASMVGANDLYCGMSMEFNDFNVLSAYFAQALFSARHAQESDGKRIQRFSDCYQMFLLDRLLAQTDPVCFCDPVLSSLWNEGKESRRELIRGYRAYLLNGRNVVASARALCVHRNTLVYRLNRLENMLGYSLKSLDEQTALIHLVSCTVLMRDELACKVQKSNG